MRGSCGLSRWVAAVLAVVAAGALTAAAQHHERKRVERAEIEQLQQQWRQAQLSENTAEMDHLLSDDFLGILAAGQVVTKAQELDRMRTRQLEITRLDVSDSKIKISGHLAVVTSLARLEGKADGRTLNGYFRYTQVYQHSPGDGWKITNFEATRVRNAAGMSDTSANTPVPNPAVPPAAVPSSEPASPGAPGSPRPLS